MPTQAEVDRAQAILDAVAQAREQQIKADQEAIHDAVKCLLKDTFKQDVVHFVTRDKESVRYNAFSQLDFGRSIESTMYYSVKFKNKCVLHFGLGNVRGQPDASIMMTLPDGTSGFLCTNRLPKDWHKRKWRDEDAQANCDFWNSCSTQFGFKLADFEMLVSTAASAMCNLTGMAYDVEVWRAPIKKRVESFVWE